MLDALELSFAEGLDRRETLLWLDADIGEGSLFRALACDIPTMLEFDFDPRVYLEATIEEITEVTEKFKPKVLLLRVNNAASEMGQISAVSSPSKMPRSMSPIDKHISIYDFASTFGVDIGWDIRKPRGEWPDPLIQSGERAADDHDIPRCWPRSIDLGNEHAYRENRCRSAKCARPHRRSERCHGVFRSRINLLACIP